jgi:CDP-diacylglycerol--glycerol-3-phosphate 3-phosphatidyltransferase
MQRIYLKSPGLDESGSIPVAPAWMVVIIVGREFVVSGLRTILATRGIALPASVLGKLKTGSQVLAIVLLIFTNTLDRWGRYGMVGVWVLWVSVVLALWSAGDYIVKFVRLAPHLTEEPAPVAPVTRGEAP